MPAKPWPPHNRLTENLRLDVTHVEITAFDRDNDRLRTVVHDPNSILFALVDDPDAIRTLTPVPGVVSAISAEPGVLYRSSDLQIAMTPNELDRYVRHDLRPEEHAALLEKFGDHFEIHDDFYDFDSGEALQPITLGRPAPGQDA